MIDEIRARAFALNYRMKDVDALAISKRYFYMAGWHSGWVNHKAIARAVDGRLTVDWSPLGTDVRWIDTDILSKAIH